MNIMDNENTNESKPSSSNPSSDKRTSPACARCRNHKVNIALKGHKRYCKYRYCTCDKCMETLARQKKMAKKTRQLRARKQDEDKKVKGKLDEEQVDPSPSDAEDPLEPVEKKRKNDNLEILLQYSLKEMYYFHIARPLISLVATIIKYGQECASEADIADAISLISREIHEIRMLIQHRACCYLPILPNTLTAPTYEGQVSCFGIGTSQNPFHRWPITWPLTPLTAAAAISTSPYPDSPPESSVTYQW